MHTEILSLMTVVVVSQEKNSGFTFWNKQFKICKTIWKNNLKYHKIPTCASSSGWSVNKTLTAVPLSEMALWNKPFARGDKTYKKGKDKHYVLTTDLEFPIRNCHLRHFENKCHKTVIL